MSLLCMGVGPNGVRCQDEMDHDGPCNALVRGHRTNDDTIVVWPSLAECRAALRVDPAELKVVQRWMHGDDCAEEGGWWYGEDSPPHTQRVYMGRLTWELRWQREPRWFDGGTWRNYYPPEPFSLEQLQQRIFKAMQAALIEQLNAPSRFPIPPSDA